MGCGTSTDINSNITSTLFNNKVGLNSNGNVVSGSKSKLIDKGIGQYQKSSVSPQLESFTSVSWAPLHQELYKKVFNLILEKGLFYNSKEERIKAAYEFKTPEELEVLVDFKLGMEGTDHDTLLGLLEKVIRYSPHHSHPFYLDKFSAGLDPLAIVGDFLATVLSCPALTYYFGHVFTLMEEEVKTRIMELVGYTDGDGIICPGVGFASVMTVRLALHKKYPDAKAKGLFGSPDICLFVSDHSTKAFLKAAFINGLGEAAVISVQTDANGRMCLNALSMEFDLAKMNGFTPLLVVATAGTASLGAIDPIDEIAAFCSEHDLWLHVDADYAGSYLLSEKHILRLKGIERSDSLNWSPTGMLGASYCATFVITRHEKLFLATFGSAMNQKYIFVKTDLYDPVWDNGDRTLQTTRRVDIVRFWLMWKAKGKDGLAQHIDYAHNLSKYFIRELQRRGKAFQLILKEFDTTKVSFYYVPKAIRELDRRLDHLNSIMRTLTKELHAKLLTKGAMQIGVSSLPRKPDFFTISVTNSALKRPDVGYILDKIEEFGDELLHSQVPLPSPPAELVLTTNPLSNSKFPHLISAPITTLHKSFFSKVFNLISEKALYFQDKRREQPYKFRHPAALLQEIDFSLRCEPGVEDEEQLITLLDQIIEFSMHQAHPYFVDQLLAAGMDPYCIMAEFVASTQPSAMQTFEQAPLYSLMEKEVCKMVRERIGFPNGDGTLCAGGSIGVITAIYTAISFKFPGSRQNGITFALDRKLVLYLSEHGHMCFKKGSLLQGIGVDNCVLVKTSEDGRMNVYELRNAIERTLGEGGTPFLVGATCGTTVLGVFDHLEEIADVCEEYNLWLHADASLGGSVMMSDSKLKTHLKGIERVDSMNFNPHKLFGVPLEASILVFKQKGILKSTFGTRDPINFPTTLLNCSSHYDLSGYAGIQTERRPNILKFWFLWKAKGIIGMGKHVDYIYQMKDYALAQIKQRSESFQIWKSDFEFPIICFQYFPQSLRDLGRNSVECKRRVDEVPNLLKNELLLKTNVVIGTLRVQDSPLLLKLVLMSSGLLRADINYILDQIEFHGKDLNV